MKWDSRACSSNECLLVDSPIAVGQRFARAKWMRAMVEHEIHHRGQIYTYLAMLDVATPPRYGLTSEDVARKAVV